MKSISTFAVAVSLVIGGAAVGAPAFAQKKQEQAQQQPQGRQFNFSKEARKALGELQTAAQAGDAAAFPAKLQSAQAVAKNADDRYFIAQMQLAFAQKTNDEAGLSSAVEAILASGGASQEELPRLYRAQADFALKSKQHDKAIAAYRKVLELQPSDATALNNLLVVYRERKAHPQALALIQQMMDASKASGQPLPENIYRLGLQTALDAKMAPQGNNLIKGLLSAYPKNPKNWADSLDVYRSLNRLDDDSALDTFRLMRQTKALQRPNEYVAFADELARRRYYAEARDVVNEAIAAGKLTRTSPSAAAVLQEASGRISGDKAALAGLEARARSDAKGELAFRVAEGYFGHGDFAKAADFYRLALQKGSVDANVVNTRLGIALAQAGRAAEAQAALKAVTGPRADLASLWLLWLSQRG